MLNLVKDSLGAAGKLWKWKKSREFDLVKSKILRHAERAQARRGGAYWHTAETLLEHGVIERTELEAAKKALQAFVLDGHLEYHEGRSYFKDHAPKYPYR